MISINATVILTILNFILLIAILSAILWKPMVKFLDDRARTIEESLKLAEENKLRTEQMQIEHDQILKEARLKATEIVDKAMSAASVESRQYIAQSKEQAHAMIESAKKEIKLEADRIKQDLRKDVASMTVGLAEKVLQREIKEADHRDLISKNLDTLGV